MKKSNLFIALFVCCAALLSLSSCSKKENEEIRIADHIEFSNLSFEVKDDLRNICSEIKLGVLLNNTSRLNVILSAENDYKWSKSYQSGQIPASGGFGVHFTLIDQVYLPSRNYRMNCVISGEVKVIDTEGKVMYATSLSQYSVNETVEGSVLKAYFIALNENMSFYYKCDKRGILASFDPVI